MSTVKAPPREEQEIRQALRDWLLKANGQLTSDQLTDQTPIIEGRVISSLRLMELIQFISRLRGEKIEVASLNITDFANVDAMYRTFFGQRP